MVPEESRRVHVVLRALRAELRRSFRALGATMSPYAAVAWTSADGLRCEHHVSRPHKGGHKSPVWNYECLQWTQPDLVAQDRVEFRVLVDGPGAWAKGRPTLCGAAVASIGDLLGASRADAGIEGPQAGQEVELRLEKRGEVTGSIWVQAVVVRQRYMPSVEWTGEVPAWQEASQTPNQEPRPTLDACSRRPHRRRTTRHTAGMAAAVGAITPEMSLDPSSLVSTAPTYSSEGAPTLLQHPSPSKVARADVLDMAVEERSPCRREGRCRLLGHAAVEMTRVDPALFELPVHRLSTSGGTAPFFRLVLRDPPEGRSRDHYLGKDLSHARDEVAFYEEARSLLNGASAARSGFEPLLGFMLEYAGVAACPVEAEGAHDAAGCKELLVMRNLRDGCESLRMLDLKVGEKTADAGWQGKSRMAALKQDVLDGLTNSKGEGFRLEGFDAPPPAVRSMDPLLDLVGLCGGRDMRKKALRFMLQRMPAAEVFMHLVDVHQEPSDPGDARLQDVRAPVEVAELALHEMCGQLARLAAACRRAPAPQKWVGSSVALGFECGRLPGREVAEADVRSRVVVRLFDWGRSELNTPTIHAELEESERQDRAAFWGYYMGGIDRLCWEAARCYRQNFGCANGWLTAHVVVYDFDSLSASDFIGQAALPLRPTEETTVHLTGEDGQEVRAGRGSQQATLTYRIAWRTFPDGSRLRGAWRVTLIRAAHLPGLDHFQGRSTSDPFAVLTAVSQDGRFRFRQQTCVVERQRNPFWGETFDLPVAADPSALHSALEEAVPGLGAPPLGPLLVHADAGDEELARGFALWRRRLGAASATARQREEFAEWDSHHGSPAPHTMAATHCMSPHVGAPGRRFGGSDGSRPSCFSL